MPKNWKQFGGSVTDLQSNLFIKTRLRLTFFYVLIIAIVLLIFSQFIYFGFSRNIRHDSFEFGRRWSAERYAFIERAENQLSTILITVNAGILIITGILSYFLAGRTLRPIQDALEQQKRFLSDASHELRTPLTILKTNIEVELQGKAFAGKHGENLKSNLEEVNHMSTLVNNLLLLSRYDSSRIDGKVQSVSLSTVLANTVKRMRKYSSSRNITITFTQGNIKNVKIKGDKDLLESAFSNIIKNAVDYNKEKGKVMIRAQSAKGEVEIKITDTGAGIAAQNIPYLFGRFYRIDESRTVTPGVGLGLSIAQAVINDCGGAISVESKINRGTTVAVTLPVIKTS